MAVPCGSVYFPESVKTEYPSWVPDPPYDTTHSRHLIRFWNVQDPALLDDGQPNHEPFAEIIGMGDLDLNSNAISCQAVEDEGRTLLFVADHGGRVFVYDVTDYLHTPPSDPQPLASWTAPLSLTDEQSNNIRSIAVDKVAWTKGGIAYEEVYVYASVFRVGIQILRFSWGTSSCTDQKLLPVELIQTPSSTDRLHLRVDPVSGAKTLLLVDAPGLRAYAYPAP